ncbi:MAG: electron transport complex subunit RsxC [Oscillospiraceae bacterium]
MLHRFYGGIRPADRKAATRDLPICGMEHQPPRVVLPLTLYGGVTAELCVKVGDSVSAGQPVAKTADGFAVLSSISGAVTAVEPWANTHGGQTLSVVVENDGENRAIPTLKSPDNRENRTAQQLAALFNEAGIAGMGGAGYPTGAKLLAAVGKVDTLILNGIECEPYCTADGRLLVEQPEKIIGGGRILMGVLGLTHCTIAVGGDKTSGVAALENLLPLRGGDISVKTLRVKYPQGSEKQLIQRLTGRQIPPDGRPLDVSCVVFNVATAAAIFQAVEEGQPLTERIVTLTGSAVSDPKNVRVPLGTPMEFVAGDAGIDLRALGGPARLLVGGPMMGTAQRDLSAPITVDVNSLVLLRHGDYLPALRREPICIRCGKCAAACPMKLLPLAISEAWSRGSFEELPTLHPTDCMGCGACSYVCPGHVPLTESVRGAKEFLREKKKEAGEP